MYEEYRVGAITMSDRTGDVVEVVRCKDCKWHRGQWQCLNTDTYGFALDDYCSLAERREDG